jgi:hypothetical protein
MHNCTVCGAAMASGETVCRHCGRAHYGPVCGACQQPAPTLVRGGKVICSACGATRGPLSGVPLNMAGQAHRVGSVVTSVLAWAVVLGGLAVGGLVGLVVSLIATFAAASVWWGVGAGLLLGGLGGVAGAMLMKGSRRLDDRAREIRDEAYEQSILAMAATRRGSVTTVEVSQQLGIALAEADRLLGEMSRRGRGLVEINSEGILQYTFKDIPGALAGPMRAGGGLTGVRVETATAGEIAKDRVDREFEEIRTRTQAQGEARRQS